MKPIDKDIEYRKVSSFINEELGLNFSKERESDLIKGLSRAAGEFGFGNISDFINKLPSLKLDREQLQILSKYLTIGETYFFREKVVFDVLRNILLPDIIAKRMENSQFIKFWSAGCSSGEEPYSIAILLNEIITNSTDWDVRILATDINTEQIKKAETGIYGEWSFRDVPDRIKQFYFKAVDKQKYEIKPFIKEMVSFSYLNLVNDSYPSLVNQTNAVDIIFCRNVLMYFDKQKREKVIANFYNCLTDGGWLIVGLTEVGYMSNDKFKQIPLKDAIIFQKIPSSYQSTTKNSVKPTGDKKESAIKFEARKAGTKNNNQQPNFYEEAMSAFDRGNYQLTADKLESILSDETQLKLLSTAEKEKTFQILSTAYANLGKLNRALSWCDKGLQNFKLNTQLYLLKANLMQEFNKNDEAIEALKKALYLDPDYIMAHFMLANMYKKIGKITGARKQFNILTELLTGLDGNTVIKDSEGITALRLKEMIDSLN